jgi:meiotically up-regulated gene 157 (Mug157) protein
MNGRGPVAANGTGLSQSWFRPSDDAQALPFHVPSNAMALVELVEVNWKYQLFAFMQLSKVSMLMSSCVPL